MLEHATDTIRNYWISYSNMDGLTNYPYKLTPFMPVSISLDTSLVPVAFMLMYQWTVKRSRNYYLWSAVLSAAFSFALKPLLVALDLFWVHPNMNYYLLFILYLLIAWASYWITGLFRYAESVSRGYAGRAGRSGGGRS